MIMTLSLFSLSFPHVLYATGTSRKVRPHSSVKDGTMCIDCSIRESRARVGGFAGSVRILTGRSWVDMEAEDKGRWGPGLEDAQKDLE